ncbi:MAG: RHS repeat protein [Proteobacteria bacterium]|nr:RHS repeat protein [Pseudomonadota bacterium]NOG58880.1 RHS repeat protein [Pseudomonadota bacterium]
MKYKLFLLLLISFPIQSSADEIFWWCDTGPHPHFNYWAFESDFDAATNACISDVGYDFWSAVGTLGSLTITENNPSNFTIRLEVTYFSDGVLRTQLTHKVRKVTCPDDWVFIRGPGLPTKCEGIPVCPAGEKYNSLRFQCEDNPKDHGPCPPGTCGIKNPINPGTGNKFQIETDYTSKSPFGLIIQRTYNSNDSVTSSRIGQNWRHSYDKSIETVNSKRVDVYRDDGKVFGFTLSVNSWIPDADVTGRLTELLNAQSDRIGWQYITENDTVEEYDISGRLISLSNRAGQTQTLDYEVSSNNGGDDFPHSLDKVTDLFGRTLQFSYDVDGQIDAITDPTGAIYTYSYDANKNLEIVTYPDETPLDSNDNPTRIYHYEDVNFIHALTGITDETGNRFATWGYDTQGRAIFSEHAGSDRADLVYNVDGTTTVTDASGNVQVHHFDTLFGIHRTGAIDGDQCTNCGTTAKNTTYDANGFVASRTDFNGNITNYINDARGLETTRTEAVGTSEERTITTEWHATFRLPIKITEPGKITTFTYDTQGRLLERSEETAP